MNVVFADFDGVLIPDYAHTGEPECIEALNLLTYSLDAKIVITSSRRDFGLIKCQDWLKGWGATAEVIDITPFFDDLRLPRWMEIAYWLDAHSEVEKYLILDDDQAMGRFLSPYLIKTNPSIGLTYNQVKLWLTSHPLGLSNSY